MKMAERQNDATGPLPEVHEEGAVVRFFELVESGLPYDSFVVQPPVAAMPNTVIPRRRVRFRADSPWKKNRRAGETLTWRGRSFVEAFAEVNRREIAQATFMEMPAGGGYVAVDGWRSGGQRLDRYHFICRTSEGAYMRIGDEHVTPRAGEVWRIDDRTSPAIFRGGLQGSMHLVLVLAPLEIATAEKKNSLSRILDEPQRSQSVG